MKESRQTAQDLDRLDRDFQYLRKPSFVPNAYENALKEMSRRKKFRQILESDFGKLRQFVQAERVKRQEYKDGTSGFLPSSFCPGLKEQVPELKLEGHPHELDFPNFPDVIANLDSPFKQNILERDTDQEIKLRMQEFSSNLEDKESLLQKLHLKI